MNIPTDFLHKFLTVGGLALTAAAGSLSYTAYTEREQFYEAQFEKYRPIKEQRAKLIAAIESESARVQARSKICDQIAGPDGNKRMDCVIETMQSLIEPLEKTQHADDLLKEDMVQYEVDAPLRQQKENYFRTKTLLSGIGVILGIGAAIVGIRRWLKAEELQGH